MNLRRPLFIQLEKFAPIAVLFLIVLVFAGQCPGGTVNGEIGTIEGTWAGIINYTYYCEGGAETIQLEIAGSSITVTGGTAFTIDSNGEISQQAGEAQAYTVTLDDGGILDGQLFVDPSIKYGFMVIDSYPGGSDGLVGVLQKGSLSSATYQESDLIGSWEGVAVRVNSNFEVTESSDSTAIITNPAGLAMSGADGDGAFSAAAPGIVLEPGRGFEEAGVYVSGDGGANQVVWPGPTSYYALYVLSYDKTVLAVAFLTSLCDMSIFDILPSQKFALWLKQ